jgi:hypothetical protein
MIAAAALASSAASKLKQVDNPVTAIMTGAIKAQTQSKEGRNKMVAQTPSGVEKNKEIIREGFAK